MKNLKEFNINEEIYHDPAERSIKDKNVIAGYSEALIIWMDDPALDYDDELTEIAKKNGMEVAYNDNSATFTPEDAEYDKAKLQALFDGLREDLGL